MKNDKFEQPDFYHFNEDTWFLIETIKSLFKQQKIKSVLDLGAGCGVLGIAITVDLLCKRVTFVELQESFIPYLKQNIENYALLERNCEVEILNTSFGDLDISRLDHFDLIVANPPYFNPEDSRPSACLQRQQCKQFVIDSFTIFLDLLLRLQQKMHSEVYFVYPYDLFEKSNKLNLPIVEIKRKGRIAVYSLASLHE